MKTGVKPRPLKERFEEKVFYASPDGCHYWLGYVRSDGYGEVSSRPSRPQKTHRAAYRLYKGEIPKGMCVCHSCDNRLCVNPDHLWLGTHADNNNDAKLKGRSKGKPRYGTENNKAKLTEQEVRLIRASTATRAETARRFGISWAQADNIMSKKQWSHLT